MVEHALRKQQLKDQGQEEQKRTIFLQVLISIIVIALIHGGLIFLKFKKTNSFFFSPFLIEKKVEHPAKNCHAWFKGAKTRDNTCIRMESVSGFINPDCLTNSQMKVVRDKICQRLKVKFPLGCFYKTVRHTTGAPCTGAVSTIWIHWMFFFLSSFLQKFLMYLNFLFCWFLWELMTRRERWEEKGWGSILGHWNRHLRPVHHISFCQILFQKEKSDCSREKTRICHHPGQHSLDYYTCYWATPAGVGRCRLSSVTPWDTIHSRSFALG